MMTKRNTAAVALRIAHDSRTDTFRRNVHHHSRNEV